MTSFDMKNLQPKSTRDRRDTEAETLKGIEVSGHERLRTDKQKAILYRCTKAKREQITRLADALSAGMTFGRKASFTDTMDAALDALEEKLRSVTK